MKEQNVDFFEQELQSSFTIEELEQRLEMGYYCCDYDGNRPDRGSCGYEP